MLQLRAPLSKSDRMTTTEESGAFPISNLSRPPLSFSLPQTFPLGQYLKYFAVREHDAIRKEANFLENKKFDMIFN